VALHLEGIHFQSRKGRLGYIRVQQIGCDVPVAQSYVDVHYDSPVSWLLCMPCAGRYPGKSWLKTSHRVVVSKMLNCYRSEVTMPLRLTVDIQPIGCTTSTYRD